VGHKSGWVFEDIEEEGNESLKEGLGSDWGHNQKQWYGLTCDPPKFIY
jgi:hypothetical protein